MGSTNKTAHYELPQFVANDKPSWLGDVNQAMEAIDTGIFGAKSSADGAQTTANNAVAGVQTANTRMDGMQTQLDTVATQANQTATAVNQHTASIATNSANINTLNSRMGNTDISDIGDGTVTGAISSIAQGGGGGGTSNLEGTIVTGYNCPNANGGTVEIPYPTGYTKDNCICEVQVVHQGSNYPVIAHSMTTTYLPTGMQVYNTSNTGVVGEPLVAKFIKFNS